MSPRPGVGQELHPGTNSCYPDQLLRTGPWGHTPALLQYRSPASPVPRPALAARYLIYSWTVAVRFLSSFQLHSAASGLGWLFPPAPCWLLAPRVTQPEALRVSLGPEPGSGLEGAQGPCFLGFGDVGGIPPSPPLPFLFASGLELWARVLVLVGF